MTSETEKKKSRLANTALILSFLALIAGSVCVKCNTVYWDSLRTNEFIGWVMRISWLIWLLLSVITFFVSIFTILWVIILKKKGIRESVASILIVIIFAGMISPILQLSYTQRYKRLAGQLAFNTFKPISKNNPRFSLQSYSIEIEEGYNEEAGVDIVEVHYTFDEQTVNWPYPKEFTVLLDFNTGEKAIVEKSESE